MGIDNTNKNIHYAEGLEDGLAMYGNACITHSCGECPLSMARGEMTCQEFLATRPAKAVALLMDMANGQHSYYDEYCLRHPNNEWLVDELAQLMCPKIIFHNDASCENNDVAKCIECWKSAYKGTLSEEEV